MKAIDRRSALALGLAATASSIATGRAIAQPSAASQGTDIAPGVRLVELGKRGSMLPGHKTVTMRDVVYQPRARSSNPSMANDMVCHCTQGQLRIKQRAGVEFIARRGDVWSCEKGSPEEGENVGSGVAIMRVIDLARA